MVKKKFIITTTVPMTLAFFQGQCKALVETYDVCAVSSPDKELTPFAKQEGIRFKTLGMKREISLLNDLIALFRWIWLLLCERPYVVHANTPKASLLAMIAAWITFRPVRIYMCHGLRYQGCTGMKRKILIWMERISCFCANQVICVSKGVREQLAEDGICCLEKSKVILYGSANGVDTEWFDPALVDDTNVKAEYGITENDFTCVFIGRIVRDKGVEELVKVTKRLHDEGFPIKLLLVGGREKKLDALSESTEQIVAKNNFFMQCGRQSDVRPFIKVSKLLVLPSYREGFGQVLVEANSLGIPVIASRIVGCKDVVNEGTNGLFCESHDAQSLYDVMKVLLENKELYDTIKKNCREYVISRFDRKKVISAYVEYYKLFLMDEFLFNKRYK